jgi:hypothetical protein
MSKPDRFTINLRAPCACGSIEMAIDGPVLSMLMCSCLDCQRATGGGHSSIAIVPAQALSATGLVKAHARPSDSGAIFTRHFCPECGTPLFGYSSRAPHMRMFLVGFFAGENEWFTPNQLIFARSQQGWDFVADHLPRHQTYREGGTP